MEYFLLAIILCSTLAQETIADTEDERLWGYEVGNGPRTWPITFPDACAGFEQSPININTDRTVFDAGLTRFEISDKYSPRKEYSVSNEEVAVEINLVGQFYVSGSGLSDIYKTEQMHFHWGSCNSIGSEHKLNGRQAPLELHIVNWASNRYPSFGEAANNPGGIAVLGILFRLSHVDNPVFEPIIQSLPLIADPDSDTHVNIPAIAIQLLFPERPDMFYRYRGSLTTPTCNEGVIWTVFHHKQTISYRQLQAFRRILKRGPGNTMKKVWKPGFYSGNRFDSKSPLVNNFRPVQSLNGRTVYRSFLI